jgi:hypothetical protein
MGLYINMHQTSVLKNHSLRANHRRNDFRVGVKGGMAEQCVVYSGMNIFFLVQGFIVYLISFDQAKVIAYIHVHWNRHIHVNKADSKE